MLETILNLVPAGCPVCQTVKIRASVSETMFDLALAGRPVCQAVSIGASMLETMFNLAPAALNVATALELHHRLDGFPQHFIMHRMGART